MQASFEKLKIYLSFQNIFSKNRAGFIYLEVVDLKINVELVRDEKKV